MKVGTIFDDSKVPLRKWFMAIYFLICSAKGISSNQLGKELGISQKTAWFMLQRIKNAVSGKIFNNQFSGTFETAG